MAGGAFHDLAGMALKLGGSYIVVSHIGAAFRLDRPLRMGAAVAGFTIDSGMAFAQPVKNCIAIHGLFREAFVGGNDGSSIGVVGPASLEQADVVRSLDNVSSGGQV